MTKQFHRLAYTLLVLGSCLSLVDQAHAGNKAADQLRKMIAANSLDAEGKAPFHLKIAFQYFDLQGKPVEAGTAEEWWVSSEHYRIVIQSPSINEVLPGTIAESPSKNLRELYLARELLSVAVHPFPRYSNLDEFEVSSSTKKTDGLALSCITVDTIEGRGISTGSPTFCADQNNALRVRSNERASNLARNSIGSFHDVNVSLDLQISYGTGLYEKIAMTGHVNALQTFDPTKSAVEIGSSSSNMIDQQSMPDLFLKGKVLDPGNLRYPSFQAHTAKGGVIAITATITREGTLNDMVVMSSSDPAFSQAVLEGYKTRTYRPFKLGDQTVEVQVNLYVNFLAYQTNHIPQLPH
jgi:hypothetical protein